MQPSSDPIVQDKVVERAFTASADGRDVPVVLWTPEPSGDQGPLPLLLVGHGGDMNKRAPMVVSIGRRMALKHRVATLAIDGPVHGDRMLRRSAGYDAPHHADVLAAWERPGTTDEMVADWKAALDGALSLPEIGDAVTYWGLSMGTIFGLPFVAAEPRLRAAVLGLMGLLGPTKDRLAADATRISIPLLFLVQMQDELFPRSDALNLFDALGSEEKSLHANPGTHAGVPRHEFKGSQDFLAAHLGRQSPESR